MRLDQLGDNPGARSARKRVGRGIGSGRGGTAGRGDKGQRSRSGVSLLGFEGGQMPLYRRLPRRGFYNFAGKRFAEVNLGRLQAAIDAGKLDPKATIDAPALIAAGLVRRAHDGVRLLAKGTLKTKITVEAAGASKAAVAAVEQAGGTVVIAQKKAATAPEGEAKRGKAAGKSRQRSGKRAEAGGEDTAPA